MPLAPSKPRLDPPPQLLVAGEAVEHVELVGRSCEAALLELAGHGDQALGRAGHVLARGAAPPGIGAGAAVREDPPGDHEARLVPGAEVGEPLEALFVEQPVREVELGLDVGLVGAGADEGRVAARPQEEADRLGQDRLPSARLAGDRVQAGRELELRLADEDEVVDPKATEHSAMVVAPPVDPLRPRKAQPGQPVRRCRSDPDPCPQRPPWGPA